MAPKRSSAQVNWSEIELLIRKLIYKLGDDPDREGLSGTPQRVQRSWATLYGGYKMDPAKVLATNFDSEGYNEIVMLKRCQFYSTCEHHLLPFYGYATLGYIPRGRVVGVSKLARLVEVYARRLQIQERMTKQIADAIEKYLEPLGCMVTIEAQHFCMTARGVEKQDVSMVTSVVRGIFWQEQTRNEFLELRGQ